MTKRILYINESLNTGSTGHIVEKLGLAAQQAGYECVVAHGARYVHASQLPHFAFSSRLEEYMHGVYSLCCNAHGLGSRMATRRLIAFIKRYQPSLIHLHNIHGYYLNYPMLFDFLRHQSVPVVWTLHDCWAMTGRCAYFTVHQCDQWKEGCQHCPSYADYPRSIVPWGTERNYTSKRQYFAQAEHMTVVPVSRWLESVVRQSYLSGHRVHTVCNGIDTRLFRPLASTLREQWRAQDKTVLLGVASQWTQTKGWSDWLQLAQRLGDRYQIVLVGVTEAQRMQLPPRCIGLKRTENLEQLVQLYSAADIYISLAHQEAFGLTLIEAMACGTPCIAYRTTAIPELIPPEHGICVADGDIEGVVKAVATFGTTAKQMHGTACREYVQSRFDEQENIQQYLTLYSQSIV